MSEGQLSPITNDSSAVYIRAYKNTDLQDCREIFTRGMEQLISLIARVILPKYFQRLAAFSAFILPIAALLQWSVTMILLYIFTCVVLFALLYVLIYVECWKFINSCLETDLGNIEKSYMSSDGSRMLIAEWNGKVVGMVGLVHNKSHKPRVAELQRMSVSPGCRRMGIARKLLDELLKHAKDQQFETVELTTTSAQTPAIRLYKKYGFKLKTVFPHHLRVLADLQYACFELQF
ncbi:probable N-acetyltransferase CML1 [Orbicella faveolata]|uniref:probable N-acetyltransferase CML1 n=1 Tax=Orbicella faveolata TaxID=48498 RepID=UPI0009E5E3D5|nr:probable N-acetyltransferase CML1 [Orbicella faveolata]